MTGHLHPFIAAAATLFDQHGWTYDLTEGRMATGFAKPLRHALEFTADEHRVALMAMLTATIPPSQAVDALLVANGFNLGWHGPQAYLKPFDDGLHPVAAISLPGFAFDPSRATETVAVLMDHIGTWVEWWAEHTDPLELSPIERWRLVDVKSPWAELLAEAGFLPEDADDIDDIEAFASELLLEQCSNAATGPTPR